MNVPCFHRCRQWREYSEVTGQILCKNPSVMPSLCQYVLCMDDTVQSMNDNLVSCGACLTLKDIFQSSGQPLTDFLEFSIDTSS